MCFDCLTVDMTYFKAVSSGVPVPTARQINVAARSLTCCAMACLVMTATEQSNYQAQLHSNCQFKGLHVNQLQGWLPSFSAVTQHDKAGLCPLNASLSQPVLLSACAANVSMS